MTLKDRYTRIVESGFLSTDNSDLRLKKSLMTMLAFPFSMVGFVWGGMFFSKSLIAGILPLFYGFWTLSTIYHAVRTKNFNLFRSSQVFFIILLPFLVQLSLGGFAQSGSVVLLSSISPFAALVFFNVKTSRIWFAAFIAVLAASYFLDEIVIAFYNNNFDTAFIKVMYFMNAFCIGFIIYIVQASFVTNQTELKRIVEHRNIEITDSIKYAKRIQSAILPPDTLIREHLMNSFILYKPKDVVSGDFYWIEPTDNGIFFAAADCTGHGVPGAMVSVICNGALNRSVREFRLSAPGEILNKTRELVIKEFEKSEEEVQDGMDIALCKLKNTPLFYSGANNPLWIIRDSELIETKADKQPIGRYDKNAPFTTHTIELQKGDSIYIFSDGYSDQFGGEKGKKFKSKAFRQLLLSIQDKTMEDQRILIDEAFETWRGNLEQIDDVCVIGVRI